jgi:hypothetical protein
MSEIYSIDWTKYKNCNFDKALSLESTFKRHYHTCDALMLRKQQLEKLVRRCDNQLLNKHFKTVFSMRKVPFYRAIIYDIFNQEDMVITDVESQILQLTKDILFIYSKKREEREYLEDLINNISARLAHEEEMRESMMEDCRGCD